MYVHHFNYCQQRIHRRGGVAVEYSKRMFLIQTTTVIQSNSCSSLHIAEKIHIDSIISFFTRTLTPQLGDGVGGVKKFFLGWVIIPPPFWGQIIPYFCVYLLMSTLNVAFVFIRHCQFAGYPFYDGQPVKYTLLLLAIFLKFD